MVNVPIVDAAVREVDIRGVFRYCNTYVIYPTSLAKVWKFTIDLKLIKNKRFYSIVK